MAGKPATDAARPPTTAALADSMRSANSSTSTLHLRVVVVVGRCVAPPCLVAMVRRSSQAAHRASERESELAHFCLVMYAVRGYCC